MFDKDKDRDHVTTDKDLKKEHDKDLNRDPISGAPGSHPVGTGVGAAGGAAAGAAVGAVGGPAGSLVGGAIGAVAGGLIGKGVAEGIDPTVEEAHWRETHTTRPYYKEDYSYDEDYLPAYRYGWETRGKYHDRRFEDVEPELERDWDSGARGKSRLTWDKARVPTRDAWQRIETREAADANRGTTR